MLFPQKIETHWRNSYLAGEQKSVGGLIIGEERIVDDGGLGSSGDAHENPRSKLLGTNEDSRMCIWGKGGGGGRGRRELVERDDGRESERRSHG